jgi:SAM-dependent methyltransferase
MSVIDALLDLARGERATALTHIETARYDEPDALLPDALWTFLHNTASNDVYVSPDAFERFINGGTNPALYDATVEALQAVYAEHWPTSVLDLGCGDGRVAKAAISVSWNWVKRLDLVEPSAALLDIAAKALAAPTTSAGETIEVATHHYDAQTFFSTDGSDRWWDVVQSTFAMHTMNRDDREMVWEEVAARTDRVVIVEFDVPDFVDHSIEHATYVAQRYEIGLHEYADDPIVQQGFLMPVLVGQFDPNQVRHTHEQSVDRWAGELFDAELDEVATVPVFDYWWAPAVAIVATRSFQ